MKICRVWRGLLGLTGGVLGCVNLRRRLSRCSFALSSSFPGDGFKDFLIFTPIPGEMSRFDDHVFQMGWFNHQLVTRFALSSSFFQFMKLFVVLQAVAWKGAA